jgi:hypothetical protein
MSILAGRVTIVSTAIVVKAVLTSRLPSPRLLAMMANRTKVIAGVKMPRAFAYMMSKKSRQSLEVHLPLALEPTIIHLNLLDMSIS